MSSDDFAEEFRFLVDCLEPDAGRAKLAFRDILQALSRTEHPPDGSGEGPGDEGGPGPLELDRKDGDEDG